MYVCLCNGHTSHQLESIARSGVDCVERAYELLGGKPDCRRCISFAKAVMADATRDAAEAIAEPCKTVAAAIANQADAQDLVAPEAVSQEVVISR